MAYVTVPKDLTKVKTKVVFNLTKRQLIFFGLAVVIGLPLFFLLKDITGTNIASFVMILSMLPCFLFAMYEKHGLHLETVLWNIVQTKFLRPKIRPYKTNNFYSAIEKQRQLKMEVDSIVKGKRK
ncbi:MAG: PrgI family protein [Clostridia bacterium]|nr:PrgI family protein [Clostridia bacterium]